VPKPDWPTAAAFLPEEQQPFVLELGVGIAALVFVAFAPVMWLRGDAPAARVRAVLPWLTGGIVCAGVAVAVEAMR